MIFSCDFQKSKYILRFIFSCLILNYFLFQFLNKLCFMPCISPPFSDKTISFSLRWLLKLFVFVQYGETTGHFLKQRTNSAIFCWCFFQQLGMKELKDWVNINLQKKQIIWRFYYLGIMHYIFEHFQRG